MKTACLFAVALCSLVSTPAYADYINGDIGFDPGIDLFDVNGDGFNFGDLRGEFLISNVETGISKSGFFKDVNFPRNTPWGDFYIKQHGTMLGTSINISNADFGSFSGTVVIDTISANPASGNPTGFADRDLFFVGSWSPGTNTLFNGFRNTVDTTIRLSLITFKLGERQIFNADMLLTTTAVPEPCSALIAGVLAGAHVYRRRRLRKTQAEACA
jgi:hypothetical protein